MGVNFYMRFTDILRHQLSAVTGARKSRLVT
jgi:hypothetical protein